MRDKITPEILLQAYTIGVFPMAESKNSRELFWVDPDERGILPLDQLYISSSLKKALKKKNYHVSHNKSFEEVIHQCSLPRAKQKDTWINSEIKELYITLHKNGFAHSIEVWQDDKIVGGLYGIALGAAFFGESMFSLVSNASKIALVYLVARLTKKKFQLLDTQFTTEHLKSLGVITIRREEYHRKLEHALEIPCQFSEASGFGEEDFSDVAKLLHPNPANT